MKLLIILLSFACWSSCKGKEQTELIKTEKRLGSTLLRELKNYQKKYPIPLYHGDNDPALYVYTAVFYKFEQDTIVRIKRSSNGCSLSGWDLIFGVYQDSQLQPTIIKDSSAFFSKAFINNAVSDAQSLKEYVPDPEIDYPESFPPVYEYRVNGKNLVLRKIDTVWSKWK
jgi:hypothetical protein